MKGRFMPPDLATDAYGFAIRPHHLQRYQQYSKIYKEEEEERSERWKHFLERLGETPLEGLPSKEANGGTRNEDDKRDGNLEEMVSSEMEKVEKEEKAHDTYMWAQTRPSLGPIEQMMSFRVKLKTSTTHGQDERENGVDRIEEESPLNGASGEESEDEFYDVERSSFQEMKSSSSIGDSREPIYSWKEELKCLVHGGVPMALRGELWQAFVGVRTRRLEGYYHNLLAPKANIGDDQEHGESTKLHGGASENWKGQIEKDLPRTFPGHPALDEDGRNALRRLLTAYARHNPSVGYCQAMNFFAGLLLLLMPEENAFWVFLGIIDDYFDGYYSEEMIESQVDQLIFEELMREKFPKLVNHLDYLGLHVAWATGPWFLSIFANMLPWESVFRVWDVLLFDGNRVMLFRTAFALMELYGPSIVIAKDAGDAITLLQSLTGSTFDSSQLVLTACMGYQAINETKLQEFRKKHRPTVLAAMEERCRGLRALKDSQGLASKLYNCKHDPGSLLEEIDSIEGLGNTHINPSSESSDTEGILHTDPDSIPYLKEQVMCLKPELCKVVKDKRSAILRAEELETALIEMVRQDNRCILSAKVEQLEREECELMQTLAEKQEQEHVMVQILMRMEHEQKVTEDARLRAEQDVAAQQSAANVLKEKYEETMTLLDQMEKRAVMAETMLEATLQYQSSQAKAQQPPPFPRTPNINQDTSQDVSTKKLS